jgi:hypothetical protein
MLYEEELAVVLLHYSPYQSGRDYLHYIQTRIV